MTGANGPTLTGAKGMGGIDAQEGFDYQVWDALIRLPAWLRNPAFEGMAVEVLEDTEARFFAPHSPHGYLLERFQAKSGTLDSLKLRDVFASFKTFEEAHPRVARVQALVTPALPPTWAKIARDPDRVRRARPFYAPFPDILAASDEKLRGDLRNVLGPDLGDFFVDHVEVILRSLPDRNHAEVAFIRAFEEASPGLDVAQRRLRAAFGELSELIARTRGAMITRNRLLDVLGETLGTELDPYRRLHIHVRSDRNGEAPDALEIDASGFSGGTTGYPPAEVWRTDLMAPVEATARWARKQGHERVVFSGSYRLSTAFSIGWAFRSAAGFDIDIPTRAGHWATDEHPAPRAASSWRIRQSQDLVDMRLVIGIGIIRDPTPDVQRHLALADDTTILSLFLPQALTDGTEVQVSIQAVKGAIDQACAKLRPAMLDVYYVGPAAFAVALGHRWNALPPTQLHEYLSSTGRYVPTALIG